MSRTPEQIAADEALTEAVDRAMKAYGADPEHLLIDYVVIAARRYWDDEGDACTGYAVLLRDSDLAVHQVAGLLRYGDGQVAQWLAEAHD